MKNSYLSSAIVPQEVTFRLTSAIAIGENLVLERDLGFLWSTTFTYISVIQDFGAVNIHVINLVSVMFHPLAIIQDRGRARIYVNVTLTIARKVGKNWRTMSQVLCDLELII